jgi:hypothetical protein
MIMSIPLSAPAEKWLERRRKQRAEDAKKKGVGCAKKEEEEENGPFDRECGPGKVLVEGGEGKHET